MRIFVTLLTAIMSNQQDKQEAAMCSLLLFVPYSYAMET